MSGEAIRVISWNNYSVVSGNGSLSGNVTAFMGNATPKNKNGYASMG
jgi:hypothetical protein